MWETAQIEDRPFGRTPTWERGSDGKLTHMAKMNECVPVGKIGHRWESAHLGERPLGRAPTWESAHLGERPHGRGGQMGKSAHMGKMNPDGKKWTQSGKINPDGKK